MTLDEIGMHNANHALRQRIAQLESDIALHRARIAELEARQGVVTEEMVNAALGAWHRTDDGSNAMRAAITAALAVARDEDAAREQKLCAKAEERERNLRIRLDVINSHARAIMDEVAQGALPPAPKEGK